MLRKDALAFELAKAVCFVFAFAWVAAASSAYATTFPPNGGKGDRAETLTCPDGFLLTGFHGRGGSWIDQLGLICSEVLPGYATGRTEKLPPRGGDTGSLIENYCDRDGGIRSMTTHVAYENGKAKVVYWVGFACSKPIDGSAAGGGDFRGDLGRTPYFDSWSKFEQSCPGNEYATGVGIRYGRGVNALGLICGPVAVRVAPAQSSERVESGMENDTNRPGSDFDSFHINDNRPDRCQSECLLNKDRCKAWTYVRPGIQHKYAVCYLKNPVPGPVSDKCCISGVLPDASRSKVTQEPGGGFASPPVGGPPAAPPPGPAPSAPSPSSPARCVPGFVWREARPTDHVCVTPDSRALVAQENSVATTRWDPNGAYGPYTCIAGYVWRESFDGDVVCVTPARRSEVKDENRLAPQRREWTPARPY